VLLVDTDVPVTRAVCWDLLPARSMGVPA